MARRLLIAIGALLFAVSTAAAQTAALSGTVADDSGALVPGAVVTLAGPSVNETAVTDSKGEYRFRNVPAGTYRLSVTLAGFATAARDSISVAQSEMVLPVITLGVPSVSDTVVVSASKVESRLINAPVTMTVIGSDVLQSTAAQNYGDLLRSVPGMNVIQTSARDISLTSRGATNALAATQLTLLDGRSVYLDFLGVVLWDFIPSNMDDVKQIEVVRGPASAIWGANAMTGVVNIITRLPREAPGTTVTLQAGALDRDAGSTQGRGAGATFGASVSTSQIVNQRWSYRLSAGYFEADAYPRPSGQIPVIVDPRDPGGRSTVGGAFYPADAQGTFGSAFQNKGTTQPRFDARFDQELTGGRLTYAAGVAGTSGTIYAGIGPFAIQRGSVLGYGKVNYSRGALKLNAFTNIVNGEAPSLLLPDPLTGKPLELNFKTQTYDVEFGDARILRQRHSVSYGGNYRRNNFDITLARAAKNRNELGGYLQDEIFLNRFRFSVGGRVDKFGNIADPVFSPRLAAIFQPRPDHSVRLSFNRAFRSPSVIHNYLDVSLLVPVDLSALSPLLPPPLRPAVAAPFPLVVHAIGSELPLAGTAQEPLKAASLSAWEVAYTGSVGRNTTVGAAFFVNDVHDDLNLLQLPATRDPYTAANPPPGWVLPPALLTSMAQLGIYLPRTAFAEVNLGPLRQKGIELSVDQRFSRTVTTFANYSWQARPDILSARSPYPTTELVLPPTNRFNVGGAYNGPRFLGNLTVNYSDKAFWSDVLTAGYHGYTSRYTLTNGTFGIKWHGGKITTSVKSTNMFNQTIQQHIFGDLIRRSIIGELKFNR